MVCNCSYSFTCPAHTPPKRESDDLELLRMDTNHLINLLLISVFKKWQWQHDHERMDLSKRNEYPVGKQTHLVDLTEQRPLIQFLSPLKRILHDELEMSIQHFLKTMLDQQELCREKRQCDNVSKCYNPDNFAMESKEYHENNLSMTATQKSPEEHYHTSACSKCTHCEHYTFTQIEAMESEFQPASLKKQNQHADIPEKIWLPDVLSLLYKQGFLNLDALFSKTESELMEDSTKGIPHSEASNNHKQ